MRNRLFAISALVVLGSLANAQIVLNQISLVEANNVNYWVSQDFEPVNNAFDAAAVEDFTVTAAQTNIVRVEAVMGLFTGTGPLLESNWPEVTGFRVNFYTSLAAATGNLTGNAGSVLVPIGSAIRTNLGFVGNASASLVNMSININLPGAGTYWVGVMGVLPAGAGNHEIGVSQNTASAGGNNAFIVNPAGGFGLPGNQFAINDDLSYRITANPVPEPGSMIALGLGVTALLARRRRKVA